MNLDKPAFSRAGSFYPSGEKYDDADEGMTIREYAYIKFAAAAIAGIMAEMGEITHEDIAITADVQARQMLKKMEESEL